jgi:serine/threonine protein kinase
MNNFFFIEEIGKGKYSVVYKGRRKQTIEYYAIKSAEKVHKEKVLNEVTITKIFLKLIILLGFYITSIGP